jgi:hypothetical protein
MAVCLSSMFILTKTRNDIWDLEGRHIVMGGFLTALAGYGHE